MHSHLGSGQAGEVTAALHVLLSLTQKQSVALLLQSAFLTGLLASLDTFTQPQLHQVSQWFKSQHNHNCCIDEASLETSL